MSGFGHPTVQESCREFPVSFSELNRVMRQGSQTIIAIDWFQYKVGERIKVIERLPEGSTRVPSYCYRYIVSIRPSLPMLGDENMMEYDLCPVNIAEL